MPIKVSYTNPANGNVIAEVELGASAALINAIADAEIAERALGGETINRPTALRRDDQSPDRSAATGPGLGQRHAPEGEQRSDTSGGRGRDGDGHSLPKRRRRCA